MNCSDIQGKINNLLRGTIKGNELRKVYYHIVKCKDCKEVLLDEFSFYTTFNDLDTSLDFNYEKKLKEFLDNIGNNFKLNDKEKVIRDIVISVAICLSLVIIVGIAVFVAGKR